MLQSLFIRIVERIPTIKDLRNRLKRSVEFSMDCGFTGSDRIPSEPLIHGSFKNYRNPRCSRNCKMN
ncbi:hypothetical protein [Lederbergia citrisecunda]|uniref:hypothetical protein n=1 Tax=Lederbergia citrisecunda TaxID=2833583 RepID=UPI003D81A8FB